MVVLEVSTAYQSPLDDIRLVSDLATPITARCEWVRHVDYEDLKPSFIQLMTTRDRA